MSILAILLWPLSITTGLIAQFVWESIAGTEVYRRSYGSGYYVDTTYFGGINPWTMGLIVFVITFLVISFTLFFACHRLHALWATPLFILACLGGVILETSPPSMLYKPEFELFEFSHHNLSRSIHTIAGRFSAGPLQI